jgi:hypothetical protein
VPLTTERVRGNLPLPVRVITQGRLIGAAGLGWDVPLSYIFKSTTTAHRRPAPLASSADPLRASERMTLMLAGQSYELVRNADDTAWLAQQNAIF